MVKRLFIVNISLFLFLTLISISASSKTLDPYSKNFPQTLAPTISSFSPKSAKTGDTITITGTNFIDITNLDSVTKITFGGTAASSFIVISNTVIKAVVAKGTSGSVKITTALLGTTSKSGFIYLKVPFIKCVSSNDYTCITINGEYLTGATSILNYGFDAGYPIVVNDSTINFCLTSISSTAAIQIITPVDTSNTLNFLRFTYFNISSFTPYSIGPGDTLSINWLAIYGLDNYTLFSNSSNIKSSLISSTDGNLKFLIIGNSKSMSDSIAVNYHPEGYCNNLNSPIISGLKFDATPIIKSVTPLKAQTGDTVIITGKYLYTDSILPIVKFGNTTAASVVPVSSTMIKVVVGAGESGDVSITNSYNVTGTYPGFIFTVNLCPNGSTTLSDNLSAAQYQWQENINGAGFTNISNNSNFSGVNSATLQLNNIPSTWNGRQYRCIADGVNSVVYTLEFLNKWINPNPSTWNIASNWSCNTVPDANTDVIITNGNITVTQNAICRSLTVMPSATLTVNSGISLTILH